MYKKIFSNSAWLYGSSILVKLIAVFYNLYLARTLGVEGFGLYTLALSYFILLVALSDFGISRFLIREGAKDRKNIGLLFSSILTLRICFTSFIFVVFALSLSFFDPSEARVLLIIFAILSLIPQSIAMTFENVFISLQKMRLVAMSGVVTSISTTIIGILLISNGFGVTSAVLALLFGEMIHSIFLMFLFALEHGLIEKYYFDFKIVKKVLLGSMPYGLLAVLGMAYFRVDALLISYLRGSYELGLYGAAYKFLEASVFIPSTLAIAIFPLMVKLHLVDEVQLKKLAFKIIWVMGGLGLIFALLFATVLPMLIKIFLPEYLASIQAVQILSLAIPFMFIHIPLAQILLSSDKFLKHLIVLSIFPLAINVVLNVLFIPRYGFIAASWITVLSDIASFLILFFVIRRYLFKSI